MADSQAQTKQRASAVEPRETLGRLGEPGIANRETPSGAPWERDHPINLRLSIPLFFGRWFFTLIGGPERRDQERRAKERRKHPLFTLGNVVFLFIVGTVIGTAVAVLMINGALDLLDGSHTVITP
jgi:hypothetical protein